MAQAPSDTLLAQVKAEAKAIANAPMVSAAGHIGRCSWCGRVAHTLTLVDVILTPSGPHERFKGECCNGK